MKRSYGHRFWGLAVLAVPLIAIAVAFIALNWPQGASQVAANTPHTTLNFSLTAGPDTNANGLPDSVTCTTVGNVDGDKEACKFNTNTTFVVLVTANFTGNGGPGGDFTAPLAAFDALLTYSGKAVTSDTKTTTYHPAGPSPNGCVTAATTHGVGQVSFLCAAGGGGTVSLPASAGAGLMVSQIFNCNKTMMAGGTGTIALSHGDANTDVVDDAVTSHAEAAAGNNGDLLNVTCNVPTQTFTPTLTSTATATRTATPTATTPPIPAKQLLFPNLSNPSASLPLGNRFLTRQGEKIPPGRCEDSTNFSVLAISLSQAVVSLGPKAPNAVQKLAAFEDEVRFDDKLVCVNIAPATNALVCSLAGIPQGPGCTPTLQFLFGGNFGAQSMSCIVKDKDEGAQVQGVARIGCFTQKGQPFPNTNTIAGRVLAFVIVRPQPELYSQIKPNQENGIVAQILDQGCKFGDELGHPIPVLRCDDADITFRFLEGDVQPDCVVNVLDTASVAFAWGSNKGSLIYREWLNLEPSGTQADGDIDIKDLQFVYGRFGSTCTIPNPAQPAVNPKA